MPPERRLAEKDLFTFQLSRVPPKGWKDVPDRDERCAELGDSGYEPIAFRLRPRKAGSAGPARREKLQVQVQLRRIRENKGVERRRRLANIARETEERKRKIQASGRLPQYNCFKCGSSQQSEKGLYKHAVSTGHFLECEPEEPVSNAEPDSGSGNDISSTRSQSIIKEEDESNMDIGIKPLLENKTTQEAQVSVKTEPNDDMRDVQHPVKAEPMEM